jgi:hypothetical protein
VGAKGETACLADREVLMKLDYDAFTGQLSEETALFLRMFFRKDDFTGQRSVARIASDLEFVADELRLAKSGPDLFGETRHAPQIDLIAAALENRGAGALFGEGQSDGPAGQRRG